MSDKPIGSSSLPPLPSSSAAVSAPITAPSTTATPQELRASRETASGAALETAVAPSDAEVVAMRLYRRPTEGSSRARRPGDTDPRLRMARNLDHIDEISAQLAEIHELIEPRNDLFSDTSPRRSVTSEGAQAPTATAAVAVSTANKNADETAEIPMWHGPELGKTMRLPVAGDLAAVSPPESRPASRPTSRRQGGIRRRLVPVAVAVAVLAIPAMVIASVQPWRDAGISDSTDSLRGGQDDTSIAASWQPESTSPSQSPDATPDAPGVVDPSPDGTPRGDVRANPRPQSPVPSTSPKTGEVDPLVLSARLVSDAPTVGVPTSFEVTWRDGSGYLGELTYTASDGGAGGVPDETADCDGVAPASQGSRPVSHTFAAAGPQTIEFTLSTYTCDGALETSTVRTSVNVMAAPPTQPVPPPAPQPAP